MQTRVLRATVSLPVFVNVQRLDCEVNKLDSLLRAGCAKSFVTGLSFRKSPVQKESSDGEQSTSQARCACCCAEPDAVDPIL